MKVCYCYRKKGTGFSLERVFEQIRRDLPSFVSQSEFYCNYGEYRKVSTYIKNMLDAKKIDADIYHIVGAVNYLAKVFPPEKTVITIHDIGHAYNSNYGLKGWVMRKIFAEFPFRRAKYLTAISNFTKKEVVDKVGISPDKIRVIHDPVSADFVLKSKEINLRHPRILCFGHMLNKNLRAHAKALEGIDCHLRIIGKLSDDEINFLNTLDLKYSNVFNISDEQILKEYELCDFLLFASLYEGFGLPVLEAQATGRPVITSDISPLTEVAENGSAIMVNPKNIASIRAGVLQLMNSSTLVDDIIARGLENVSRFSGKNISAQYAELYEDILK